MTSEDPNAANTKPSTVSIEGQTFGRFALRESLGRGGQGVVYRAYDTRLKRDVALKMLTGPLVREPSFRARLLREAEAAGRLDHPGICAIYDAGEEDDVPYIAMRYIEGETLSKRIADARSAQAEGRDFSLIEFSESGDAEPEAPNDFPPTMTTSSGPSTREELMEVIRLIERTARALHVAHESGLVHRDIKPGNIMVAKDGPPVLLDFGLVRDETPDTQTLTQTGQVMGTPAYMAPEQITGAATVDRRADVYSLGVTLFEVVTLSRPFEAPTREQLFRRILTGFPPDPRKRNPQLPTDLCSVLTVTLDKDPNRRYATAEAFADDLARIRRYEPILARPPRAIVRFQRWVRRQPAMAALLAGALVLCVVGGYLAANWGRIGAQRAAERAAEAERFLLRGYHAYDRGRFEEADELFQSAQSLQPDAAHIVAARVRAVGGTDRVDDAFRFLDEHHALEARIPALARVRVHLLELVGRREEADALKAKIRPIVTAEGHVIAGRLAFSEWEKDRTKVAAIRLAYDHFHRAVLAASAPRSFYHCLLAEAAGHVGDVIPARRIADTIVMRWPDVYDAWLWRGYTLERIGDLPEASEALERAIELDPTEPLAWRYLGVTYDRLGQVDKAIEAYRGALERKPDYDTVYVLLGDALRRSGRLDEAFVALRRGVELAPRAAVARIYLARASRAAGDRDGALSALDRAVALDPDLAEAHIERGRLLREMNRLDEAVDALERGLARRPDDADALLTLGLALRSLGRIDEAVEAFRTASKGESESARFAHLFLGHALAKSDPDAAADAYDRFVVMPRRSDRGFSFRLDASEARTAYDIGLAFNRAGRPDHAVVAFRAAIAADPLLARAYCNLAAVLQRQGEVLDALVALRKGDEIGAKEAGWPAAVARDIRRLEQTVLRDAIGTARRAANDSAAEAARNDAARGLHVVFTGWRERIRRGDAEAARMTATIERLLADDALSALNPPDALPEAERERWREVWKLAAEISTP